MIEFMTILLFSKIALSLFATVVGANLVKEYVAKKSVAYSKLKIMLGTLSLISCLEIAMRTQELGGFDSVVVFVSLIAIASITITLASSQIDKRRSSEL